MHYISTCKKLTNTKLGKVLTYSEKLLSLNPHETLMAWPTWGHLIISKIYFCTITRVMACKPGRVLTFWWVVSARKHLLSRHKLLARLFFGPKNPKPLNRLFIFQNKSLLKILCFWNEILMPCNLYIQKIK